MFNQEFLYFIYHQLAILLNKRLDQILDRTLQNSDYRIQILVIEVDFILDNIQDIIEASILSKHIEILYKINRRAGFLRLS